MACEVLYPKTVGMAVAFPSTSKPFPSIKACLIGSSKVNRSVIVFNSPRFRVSCTEGSFVPLVVSSTVRSAP